jgi:hypothetical protein
MPLSRNAKNTVLGGVQLSAETASTPAGVAVSCRRSTHHEARPLKNLAAPSSDRWSPSQRLRSGGSFITPAVDRPGSIRMKIGGLEYLDFINGVDDSTTDFQVARPPTLPPPLF